MVKIETHGNNRLLIRSVMLGELWKNRGKKHINGTAKSKRTSNKLENLFFLENALSFTIIFWLEKKKLKEVDKVFLVKQQTNPVQTWWGQGEAFGGVFYWRDGSRPIISKKMILRDTNTVISLTTVIIVET